MISFATDINNNIYTSDFLTGIESNSLIRLPLTELKHLYRNLN